MSTITSTVSICSRYDDKIAMIRALFCVTQTTIHSLNKLAKEPGVV